MTAPLGVNSSDTFASRKLWARLDVKLSNVTLRPTPEAESCLAVYTQ